MAWARLEIEADDKSGLVIYRNTESPASGPALAPMVEKLFARACSTLEIPDPTARLSALQAEYQQLLTLLRGAGYMWDPQDGVLSQVGEPRL